MGKAASSDLGIAIIEKRTVINALEHVLTKEKDPAKRKSIEQNLDEVGAELKVLLEQQEKGTK